MDGAPSTVRSHVYPDESSGTGLPPFITIVVLVAGVLGGLILVISVILFCKYCIKRKKVLKRQPVIVKRTSQDRSYRGFKQFESLESTISTDPGSVGNSDVSVKPILAKVATDQLNEKEVDLNNEIDAAVIKYKRSLTVDSSPPDSANFKIEEETKYHPPGDRSPETPKDGSNRHVSFVLNEKGQRRLQTSRSLSMSRYTEGDFHYLKNAKISRSEAVVKVAKQRSLGSSDADLTYSSGILDDPPTDDANETTPMLSPVQEEPQAATGTSAFRTEVAVEVHRDPNGSMSIHDGHRRSPPRVRDGLPRTARLRQYSERRSASIDVVSAYDRRESDGRRSHSYEGATPFSSGVSIIRKLPSLASRSRGYTGRDYNRLAITQFNRGPFYSADYDIISEDQSPEIESKVRYNDMGSLEEVNHDEERAVILDDVVADDMNFEESDSDTAVLGIHSYREIWNLRATLEEEEDFSDNIRMEDMMSPEGHSPEEREEHATTSHTTSFESNTDPLDKGGMSSRNEQTSNEDTVMRKSSGPGPQLPASEARRDTYRSILTKRLKRISAPSGSTENSFDSAETMETDGEVSDTSRQDVTTTSFESTTDSAESNSHKLQQMRGDSGYKSLETQQSSSGLTIIGKPLKKQIHFVLDHETSGGEGGVPSPEDKSVPTVKGFQTPADAIAAKRSAKSAKSYFERRNAKTASKKRREYRAERQVLQLYASINEPESDSRSDYGPSGDSFDESCQSPRKPSLFSRFLKTHSRDSKRAHFVTRDYSMDETTSSLFNEFVRYDPALDSKHQAVVRRPASRTQRLQRKQSTDPGSADIATRRRGRLAPGLRSASLGSDSSLGSGIRRLSPQDSIEEELGAQDSSSWQSETSPIARTKVDKDIPIAQPLDTEESVATSV